jgi:hypothetical protein
VATPVILATQEAEMKKNAVQNQGSKEFARPYLGKKKKNHKKGLAEWLKV